MFVNNVRFSWRVIFHFPIRLFQWRCFKSLFSFLQKLGFSYIVYRMYWRFLDCRQSPAVVNTPVVAVLQNAAIVCTGCCSTLHQHWNKTIDLNLRRWNKACVCGLFHIMCEIMVLPLYQKYVIMQRQRNGRGASLQLVLEPSVKFDWNWTTYFSLIFRL